MTDTLVAPLPPPMAEADLPALPPTQDDLPYDDGIFMETPRHYSQLGLLMDALNPWLDARSDGFTAGNMFLYFSLEQVRHNNFVGPDFFVVLDVPKGERKSWVIWEEGKGPDLVIEFLSASTGRYDKTTKKSIYARQIRVPEYYWYDPYDSQDFAGFSLHGNDYQLLNADGKGRLFSSSLQLCLGPWPGTYKGVEAVWLRWFTPEGEMLLTEAETAEQRAETAEQRADRMAQRLRQLGIDPDAT